MRGSNNDMCHVPSNMCPARSFIWSIEKCDGHCSSNGWRGIGQEGPLHQHRISSGQTAVLTILSPLDGQQLAVGKALYTLNIYPCLTDNIFEVGQTFCTCKIFYQLNDLNILC